MTDSLKSYMDQRRPVSLDREALRDYMQEMKDEGVPKIEQDIRENERMATELRYSAASRDRNHHES